MIETLFTSWSGKGIKYTRQTEKFWSINQVIVAHDHVHICVYVNCLGFQGGPVVKNQPANARDVGLILGWEDHLE